MAAVDRQSLPACPGEESPDCTEREVLFSAKALPECERRILRTICRRKESATEKIPPDFSGKGEKAG